MEGLEPWMRPNLARAFLEMTPGDSESGETGPAHPTQPPELGVECTPPSPTHPARPGIRHGFDE